VWQKTLALDTSLINLTRVCHIHLRSMTVRLLLGNQRARNQSMVNVSVMMQRDLISWRVCFQNCRGHCLFDASAHFENTIVLPATRQPQYLYMSRSLNLIVHPGGDAVSTETRGKPQPCCAHGKVRNQIESQGSKLYGHCDKGEDEVLELYHADGPSANTSSRQSTSLAWGS
jgi:hypothetical protein